MKPSTQVLTEPSVRNWLTWTPARVKLADRQADSGSLRLAAELCDAMMADDRVQGCLNVRARGLLSLDLSFEKGPGSRKSRAVKFLEAQEDWDETYPIEQLGQLNLWGIFLGVGLGQNLWTERDNKAARFIPKLDTWHPRHLRYDALHDQWYLLTQNSGEIPITPGDGKWILYTPGGVKRPWSHGVWRAVARWWLLKQYAMDDWGLQGQNAAGTKTVTTGQPPTVADGKGDVRRENRQQLADDINEMAKGGTLVLPPGFDFKVVSQAVNSYESYRAQIDCANTGIAVAINGQNLTTEVSGGSFAAAEVHKAIAGVLLASDASTLATCIHDQALVWWSVYNLGDKSHAPWPLWDTTPPADLVLMTQVWNNAADAAMKWQRLADDAAKANPDSVTLFDVDIEALADSVGLPMMRRVRPVVEEPPPPLFVPGQLPGQLPGGFVPPKPDQQVPNEQPPSGDEPVAVPPDTQPAQPEAN
jgi:hypothetical protein